MKGLKRLLLPGLGALLVALSAATGASAQELTYATFEPPKADIPRLIITPFAEDVAAKTNGEVTFNVITGGSLLGAPDTLAGIRDGIADAGFVVPAFVVSSLPHVNLVPDLLSFADDAKQVAGATLETLLLNCPECQQDYAKMGAVNLGTYGHNPYWILCSSPVESIADLEGKKIRVSSAPSGRWIDALGAVAVSGMPPPEIVTGMQRGQVDCAITVPNWLRAMSLEDAVEQVITFPNGTYHGLGVFVFNKDSWDSISPENKQIVLRAIADATAAGTIQGAYFDEPALVNQIIADKGIASWDGGDEFPAAWEEFRAGEIDAVIAGAEKRGIDKEVAQRIVETHLAALEKWKKISDEVGDDKEKFAQALWDEVYSKLGN